MLYAAYILTQMKNLYLDNAYSVRTNSINKDTCRKQK